MKKPIILRKIPVVSLALALTVSLSLPSLSSAANADPQINSFLKAQEALTIEAAPAFVSPELSTDSSRQVRVIVQLDGEPLAVDKYAARSGIQAFTAQSEQKAESAIATEQTTFVDQAAEHGISLQVNYQYNTVLNGLEVTLPANKIPELAKLPGVKSIHENKTYYSIPVQDPPTLTASEATYDNAPLDQIGVPEAWAKGLTGEGIKVGVIDTGIDYEHPDLKEAYKGGYDSFEQDNDPYEEPFLEKENDPYGTGFSGTTHGTHVSGTIAGKAANKSSEIVQKGIAYKSDLYVYKVLGRNTKTGRSSGSSAQVIDGIERAVKDGMNVINLSLGSDSEKDPNSPDSIAINNAVLSGVVAVIANGNAAQDGPYFYSMGSPATSQLAISVGAATSPSKSFSGTASVTRDSYWEANGELKKTVTADAYAHYGFNLMGWETGREDFASILGTAPYELVYANLGQPDDFEGKDVTGKIVLVSRGNLAFVDKITNAKENGAKAVIVFNGNTKAGDITKADLGESISGRDDYVNSNLGDSFDFIPTFDMKGKEGRALAKQLVDNAGEKFSVSFGADYIRTDNAGDTMAGFSSRGPNGDELLSIKPDVSAPGVGILSTYPAFAKFYPDASYEQAYKRSNGTSMASPHVAGLAVLLKQQHPNWTPFDIRAALANTSVTLFDEDKIQYDVYSQGAGLVNIANAIQTPALLETVEKITILDKNFNRQEVVNYNPSASFGVLRPGSDAKQIQLQLKNLSANPVQYEASYILHDNVTSDPTKPIATPDVSNIAVQLQGIGANGAISAEPGKSQPFFLSVQPNSGVATGVYEGEVILKSAGLPTLHLPFVVHVGKENPATGFGLQDLSVTNPIIYPSRTGSQRSTDLAFRLTTDKTNQIALYVYGVDDKLIGLIDGITTSKEQGANARLKQGAYSFKNIDGSYVELDDNGKPVLDANGQPVIQHLKDGVYKLEVSAPELNAKGEVESDADGPKLFTATKAIRVDNSATSGGSGGGGGGGGGGRSNTTPSAATNTSTPVAISAPSLQSVVKQGQAVKAVTTAVAVNNNVQSLTVTDADLQAAVTAAGSSPTAIVLSAASQAGQTTKASLTSAQLATLSKAAAGSSLIVSNTGSSLALPVSALKTEGAGIEVVISSQAQASSTFTGKLKGSNVIGTPVGFEANIVTGGKSQPLKVAPGQFISRSFTVPGQIDSNTAGVLYTANGNVYPVPSVFTKQADGSTVVKVSRPGFSTYAAATRPVSFEDISSSYAQSEIQSLANKLLINGTTDTTFSPKKNVTRAEFAALVTRALGLTPGTAAPFSDIPAGSWYSGDVAAAYEAGLITGRNSDKFDPNANISRQEIAVVLGKAVDLLQIKAAADGPARTPYHDASSFAGYAKDSIEKVSAAGIINGEAIKGSSYFQPNAPTTREASAKVLHVLLQKAALIN